jgi:GDPmannose 4,6-dehydratase
MMQRESPRDFVIATGETHRLAEFVEQVFVAAGLDWRAHVDHDQSLMRPTDLRISRADTSRASAELGWRAGTRMADVARLMVAAERERA